VRRGSGRAEVAAPWDCEKELTGGQRRRGGCWGEESGGFNRVPPGFLGFGPRTHHDTKKILLSSHPSAFVTPQSSTRYRGSLAGSASSTIWNVNSSCRAGRGGASGRSRQNRAPSLYFQVPPILNFPRKSR
jgi:hypothetical protein